MARAVFLDRDGTIIEDRGHLRDPSQVVFFPDTFDALRRLQQQFLLFIVTNQPGVSEKTITREDVDRVNDHVVARLAEADVHITRVYVCPHARAEGCTCIKPEPYFLRKAARQYQIDLEDSFTVGDHPHDVALADGVGAEGIYVLTGHGTRHRTELPPDVCVAAGIREASLRMLAAKSPAMGRGTVYGNAKEPGT